MSAPTGPVAFGDEVIHVSDDIELARLLRDARDEAAAVAGLEACVDRLRRARDAQAALASLPADQLRAALRLRRTDLAGRAS